MKPTIRCSDARHCRGTTLIELMISMALGLVIIGGATGAILANRQTYRTNEALSQVQESARTAFELLSRDVREAGATGCDSTGRIANVLGRRPPRTDWWQTWYGIRGDEGNQVGDAVNFGTATATRVEGTDSIALQGIQGLGLSIESHNATSANIKISAATTDIVRDDVLIVCDFDHATIFQVSNYNNSNVTLGHNIGQGTPGNCSKGLGYPSDCDSHDANGNVYRFDPNAQIARLAAVTWYIGNNGRAAEGGRSLYRVRMGAGATLHTEEIVAGVGDMQLLYREDGGDENAFVAADEIGDWTNVNAVQIALTIQSGDQRVTTDAAVNSGRLQREFANIVTLRNRVP